MSASSLTKPILDFGLDTTNAHNPSNSSVSRNPKALYRVTALATAQARNFLGFVRGGYEGACKLVTGFEPATG